MELVANSPFIVRRRILSAAVLALLTGCRHPQATASAPNIEANIEAIDDAWFAAALAADEVVAVGVARAYASEVLGLVERRIFDPALVREHAAPVRAQVERELAERPGWSRAAVVDVLNRALGAYGVSHLGVALPTVARTALGLDRQQPIETIEPAVAVERRGTLAILRITSFMVPEITHASVQRAFDAVAPASALLIDLRGNGGGSASSVVYTAQYLTGAGVLTQTVRTRSGADRRAPHALRGFFADADNSGSDADVNLNRREGYVEWWTPDDAPAPVARPVFVLVDAKCASACEIFAAAVQDAGVVEVLGARTAGVVLAGQGVRSPWPGYLLVIPFGTVTSPAGRVIEGQGVEPDVVLESCAAAVRPTSACFDAAIAYIDSLKF